MMYPKGYPKKQGLYDPKHEGDACGMGFIAHKKGEKSHAIVENAIEALCRLTHRGACGCEANTGDGAGLMIQIPHAYFAKVCTDFKLEEGRYGVAMVFMPKDNAEAQDQMIEVFSDCVDREGLTILGWRDVPCVNSSLGSAAKSAEPTIKQVFIARPAYIDDPVAFERKLYVARRRAESTIAKSEIADKACFYIPSMSARTIVYKGMLLAEQVSDYYTELKDPDVVSAIAMVHSRFATNTFPAWERAHPNRYAVHNGEINTLKGNVNMMKAKEALFESELFGEDIKKILPVIDENGSDSSMMDNCLEFLTLAGYDLPHAVMMMIPEPWVDHNLMSDERKAFYDFHSCMMEPWDGPASIAVTDGTKVCAVLDRNGLRPSRYYVTKDDWVVMASEVGVMDIDPANVAFKGRLEPGRMFMVDTEKGQIINDEELKHEIVTRKPYRKWLNENLIHIDDIPFTRLKIEHPDPADVLQQQKAFGYSLEDIRVFLEPMSKSGLDAIGAMGDDSPLAVLSSESTPLYDYFRQLFAQVTNPPLDASFEAIVTSTITTIGGKENLLQPGPSNCRQIRMETPVLTNSNLEKLKQNHLADFPSTTIPMLFDPSTGAAGLEAALENCFKQADEAIANGCRILVLSDRGVDENNAAIPALLASAGMHHHLIRQGTRSHIGLVIETGEAREVHHFCCLLGYGASAINPYLAYETLDDMIHRGLLNASRREAVDTYNKAVIKGTIKVMSKVGISTVQSYRGAQIFEALGLKQSVVDKYFSGTDSRVEGIGMEEIAADVAKLHKSAFAKRKAENKTLKPGGRFQWRKEGEKHLFSPESIHQLQSATRNNDPASWDAYSNTINDQNAQQYTLRGLLDFQNAEPIPIDEVESADEIMKRFKTGAMSYGSISKEAHETLAIAMNRIGGKSNTGEGGEEPYRYEWEGDNGDSKNSAIKQVASGRFGVTSLYLTQAKEIQIKMAQGAKPGEGGQLPGSKVYPWVAKTRHSTPGVGLISPPPHHDIYSIEDMAQLIHDLKNANENARINVKLVSKVGVGTIAAGVAKGKADVILIAGHDGGTGASPLTSVKHAGLPWELGLSETHQTLLLNGLRSRVVVETDGQLKTGRDVAIATLLGAEEFGFATAPLVVMGCIMMRVCHKNTCPVGVATQDPRLRDKFTGNADHVVNFFKFIAEDLRKIMAELGFRTLNEMVGRVDKLEPRKAVDHWKSKGLDLSPLIYRPEVGADVGGYNTEPQDHGLEKSLDKTILLELCKPAIQKGEKVKATVPIKNTDRVVGTQVGSAVTKKWGIDGLPDDTIHLTFKGSAGQSLGAFCPKGVTLRVEGDTNDYLGKGLSGGRLIVTPDEAATFKREENIITGNVAFFGATSGEAFISGVAGERFCVRNSGVHAVVEGVGDHGCEYMTGGRAIILGSTGRNFAAGMSGGIAYVLDTNCQLSKRTNHNMVYLETLQEEEETAWVKTMIEKHLKFTGSDVAKAVLDDWDNVKYCFTKVFPTDYKHMLELADQARAEGVAEDDIPLAAFERSLT